jgi:uroporphyrin-III C-methyltransferase/precorrin-2 dehydrogenase/sirohydrochlorin ferrochelatase
LRAATPVGIVVNAGRAGRALYRGTLGELAQGAVDFADGPAVILVGEAVAAGDWQDAAALAERQFRAA